MIQLGLHRVIQIKAAESWFSRFSLNCTRCTRKNREQLGYFCIFSVASCRSCRTTWSHSPPGWNVVWNLWMGFFVKPGCSVKELICRKQVFIVMFWILNACFVSLKTRRWCDMHRVHLSTLSPTRGYELLLEEEKHCCHDWTISFMLHLTDYISAPESGSRLPQPGSTSFLLEVSGYS